MSDPNPEGAGRGGRPRGPVRPASSTHRSWNGRRRGNPDADTRQVMQAIGTALAERAGPTGPGRIESPASAPPLIPARPRSTRASWAELRRNTARGELRRTWPGKRRRPAVDADREEARPEYARTGVRPGGKKGALVKAVDGSAESGGSTSAGGRCFQAGNRDPGEVLIQVKAAGLNPGESKIREGLMHPGGPRRPVRAGQRNWRGSGRPCHRDAAGFAAGGTGHRVHENRASKPEYVVTGGTLKPSGPPCRGRAGARTWPGHGLRGGARGEATDGQKRSWCPARPAGVGSIAVPLASGPGPP